MIDLAIDGRIFIDDYLDEALQELDLLFNTENTELIGYPNYGTRFEDFLWQLTPSEHELSKYIKEKISHTLFLSKLDPNIYVQVLPGEYRNIYYVKITVKDGNNNEKFREYQFR